MIGTKALLITIVITMTLVHESVVSAHKAAGYDPSVITENKRASILPKNPLKYSEAASSSSISVVLLKKRGVVFDKLFLISHLIALIRCIVTIGQPYQEAVAELALSGNLNLASQGIYSELVMLPSRSLPAIGPLLHALLSMVVHIVSALIIKSSVGLQKLLYYRRVTCLDDATAAYVGQKKAGSTSSSGISNIVELNKPSQSFEEITSTQLTLLLSLLPTATDIPEEVKNKMDADSETCRVIEHGGLQHFIFERPPSKQRPDFTTTDSDSDSDGAERESSRRTTADGKEVEDDDAVDAEDDDDSLSESHNLVVITAVPNLRISVDALSQLSSIQSATDTSSSAEATNSLSDDAQEASGLQSVPLSTLTGLSTLQANTRRMFYGRNAVQTPMPSFRKEFSKKILTPTRVFQLLTNFLTILEEDWKLPLFRIINSIGMDSFHIFRNVLSARSLYAASTMESNNKGGASSSSPSSSSPTVGMGTTPLINGNEGGVFKKTISESVIALRDGVWSDLSVEDLVPGDMILLGAAKVR
jgi:hypothetical protein